MTWRQRLFWVLSLLAAPALLLAADAPLPDYLPTGARMVIGIRVRGLVDALASTGMGKDAQEAFTKNVSQPALGGIDVFRDLDEVWFATTGVGHNPPFLAVMTGRFSEGAFSPGGKRYRNAWIVESSGKGQEVVAWVDAGTALAGDLTLVKAALDRSGAAAPVDPAMASRAAALRGKYDIWGIGNPVAGAKTAGAEDPLSTLDRFDFGIAFAHGLELVADLHVRSSQDLEKLSATLKMLELALSAQPANANGAHFDLRTGNGGIHIAVSIPEEELKKVIAAQRAAITSAVASQLAGRGVAIPAITGAWGGAAPATTSGAVPASAGSSKSPATSTGEIQILKNSRGDTVMVTLPGKQ